MTLPKSTVNIYNVNIYTFQCSSWLMNFYVLEVILVEIFKFCDSENLLLDTKSRSLAQHEARYGDYMLLNSMLNISNCPRVRSLHPSGALYIDPLDE